MNPNLVRAALDELARCGRGERTAIIDRYAAAAGLHPNTVRRALALGANGHGRPAPPPRVPPELVPHLETLVRIKKAPPKATGCELSLRRALRIGIEHRLLGDELARYSESTLARWVRSLGLGQEERRVSRWQASRPNELHQFDVSQSSYCRVDRVLPDGDVLLVLSPHGPEYKNKPLGPDRLRWWVYAEVDDHSGYRLARGTAALGENAADGLAFLRWAWAPKADAAIPMCGRPENLMLDNGPLAKDRAFAGLFTRLGIPLLTGEPGNSQARGKVERPFRDLWAEFERPFFVALAAGGDYRKIRMTGAEYNAQLLGHLAERNELAHRSLPCTKREAWQAIAGHGGPVLIPEEAWGTAVRPPVRRWVDRQGCISFKRGDVARWEVPGLLETHVDVLEGALDDRLVAVDVATGRKVECRPARMLGFGEYRSAKTPPGASLRARPPQAGTSGASGVSREASGERRVAAFRPRGDVMPMPEDPRGGALSRVPEPIEDAIAATEQDNEVELDRYGVLDLFRGAGIPEAAARAFLWARLPGAAMIAEGEAGELITEFKVQSSRFEVAEAV